MSTKLWKRRVAGKLVFKFQKPSGVSGTPWIKMCHFFSPPRKFARRKF